ncbi:MAG TPA: RNA polymerase sigma factor [Ktedonosporobacter sp.]|jgi:RNA polymerase sigma-70 factor (ECF subfamily)|nr:RNA polymerase sigma factor [Ktedonosporobacter sp.]
MEYQVSGVTGDFLSQDERAQLVGLCARISGDLDAAEDLAQETLFLAWRHMQNLRDAEKRTQWMAGIARNVCLRWLRQRGRDLAHSVELSRNDENQDGATLEEIVADEFDMEIELERKELVELLERALKLLPTDTRNVMIKRYIEESPLAAIAEQLGTNTSAIAMRLQRGKLALRKVLTSDLQQEIAAYAMTAATQQWETTSLWCNYCGKHHLLGKKRPENGLLYLKCPECCSGDEVLSKNELPLLKGIKSFKPAYARLGAWCHHYYRTGLRDGTAACDTCGRQTPVKIGPSDKISWLDEDSPRWIGHRNEHLVSIICTHCLSYSRISLEGLILVSPEGRRFQQQHQRIRTLPIRSIEFAGRPALVTSLESINEHASFEVISDEETYEVLKIYGGTK